MICCTADIFRPVAADCIWWIAGFWYICLISLQSIYIVVSGAWPGMGKMMVGAIGQFANSVVTLLQKLAAAIAAFL